MTIIAVTGGTGFIGRHLIDGLTAAGHDVVALTRREASPRRGVKWLSGSLHDSASLRRLIDGADVVVHCAGAVKASDARAFDAANAQAVSHIAGIAALQSAPPLLIHLSSLAARQPELSPYAASKAAGEEALSLLAGMPWVSLRPPAVYGPGDLEILKVFKSLRFGIGFVPGSGEGRLSILHVRDLVAAILALMAAERPAVAGATFELSDPREDGYTFSEIYDIAGRVLGRRARLIGVPRGLLTTVAQINRAMARLTGDTPMLTPEKVAELLHPDWVARGPKLGERISWSPKIGLEEGLRETLAWYRAEGHL